MTEKKQANIENPDPVLVVTRLLDAPRSLVFQVWTDPEHLQHWQGAPRGFTVTVEELAVRPGGKFRICMHSSEFGDQRLQ